MNLQQSKNFVTIRQYQYIEGLKPIEIDSSLQNDPNRFLTVTEKSNFLTLVGQIRWCVNMSRPDMSYAACELGSVQSKPKLLDLKKANKYLRDMKSDQVCLKFCHLDMSSLKLTVYADASFGNLPDGGSQGGHIIFLSDEYGRCSVISWCSKRIRRVARSTLSAETQAVVEALDSAYLISKCLDAMLDKPVGITLYTDNKSLNDSINTTNLAQDKRLRVDLAALREINDNNDVDFKWVDTKSQIADVLTKKGVSKHNLLQILQQSCFA